MRGMDRSCDQLASLGSRHQRLVGGVESAALWVVIATIGNTDRAQQCVEVAPAAVERLLELRFQLQSLAFAMRMAALNWAASLREFHAVCVLEPERVRDRSAEPWADPTAVARDREIHDSLFTAGYKELGWLHREQAQWAAEVVDAPQFLPPEIGGVPAWEMFVESMTRLAAEAVTALQEAYKIVVAILYGSMLAGNGQQGVPRTPQQDAGVLREWMKMLATGCISPEQRAAVLAGLPPVYGEAVAMLRRDWPGSL